MPTLSMDRLPLVYIHYIHLIYKHLPLPFHLFLYRYPTRVQLSAVAQAIVIRDYPFLKDRTVGSGYVSIHYTKTTDLAKYMQELYECCAFLSL